MTVGFDFDEFARDTEPDSVLTTETPAGSPTTLPVLGPAPAHSGERRLRCVPFRPVVVVGAHGGSGSTTTAYGIASGLGEVDERWPVVVDATAAGGDLARRVAAPHLRGGSMQALMTVDEPGLPAYVESSCGRDRSGEVGVLARTDAPLPRRHTLVSVHRALSDAGVLAVYDAGAPITSRAIRPLLCDPQIAVAVTVSARPDCANRLRDVMGWLDAEFGEYLVSDMVIVVCTQTVSDHGVGDHIAAHLGPWVRGVVEIGYDPHLASGESVHVDALDPRTRNAYSRVIEELS